MLLHLKCASSKKISPSLSKDRSKMQNQPNKYRNLLKISYKGHKTDLILPKFTPK